MTLISERATIMSQLSISTGICPQYPSQIFSPPLVADSGFTLLAAMSTQVPQVDRMFIGNEERGAIGGTPLGITSCSLSTSSGMANIDLTQEILDEKSREKLKGKIGQIENKLKKERELHRAMLANYKNETMQDMEETRYRMHLYQYKQKIQQCEILLAYTGCIQALKTIPPSLASPVKPTVSPTLCSTSQVPFQSTGEMGQPSTATQDAAQADALVAV